MDIYYLWLSLVTGPNSNVAHRLLEQFSNAENIYKASADELREKFNFGDDIFYYKRLCDKNLSQVNNIAEYCIKNNIKIINCNDELYPKRLRNIRGYPLLLYYKGTFTNFDRNLCLAMVGTRSMTDYGKYMAYHLARGLADAGVIVVSGMAKGIDSTSHKGALIEGKYTAAVLGCGVDVVFPKENAALYNRICEQGVVISEYPPHTEPLGRHFPVRNRIISGLCQACMVVEADEKSGALITAKSALYEGRDLFAVPGYINVPESTGPNNLIKDGAIPVTEPYDILKEYEYLYSDIIKIDRAMKKNSMPAYVKKEIQEIKTNIKPEYQNKNKPEIKIPEKKAEPDIKINIENTVKKNSDVSYIKTEEVKNIPDKEAMIKKELALLEAVSDGEIENGFALFEFLYNNQNTVMNSDSFIIPEIKYMRMLELLTFLDMTGVVQALPGNNYKIKSFVQ